mmetsp:Transcript_26777/g.39613  ORF Transcript_26777/g.39613 Transcript_26777/m.39613 type:complete len:378 (+) Transcript_26777:229-1362(+)|eukprot:CAMPEP_0194206624 /NCGR_PEP_ID=MMETSP0156-20130528/5593_1 /TAXON_ID=33649 /ORGANISM="Thalassionema nitzschioides, Strain L26-B" /LENGTH=377 /DNA_ID=CAMNT_0038933185 /DNA_START=165 /DNA_END=1295 /DNA_ORIENTATION=+
MRMYDQKLLLLLCVCVSINSAFVLGPSCAKSGFISSKTSLFAAEDKSQGEKRRRLAEFHNLEPLPESKRRRERVEREKQIKIQFADYGNDLWQLRSNIEDLSSELVEAISKGDQHVENGIRKTLRKVEKRDPEIVYNMELEKMKNAANEGRVQDELRHKNNALNARSILPQFNLEGLWVGKYGDHGYEMINVTYAGDTLIAYKVTGDANVPRGEVTFQVDLNPIGRRDESKEAQGPLNPIILTENASKKWGTKQLPRYHGLGRVAEENFKNSQWMQGQLIIIGKEYFSFAWVPIEHQIFFGRPSPELALKMLRDCGVASLKDQSWEAPPTLDDDINVWKAYATHCFERTEETIEEELSGNEYSCIWEGADAEECYFE